MARRCVVASSAGRYSGKMLREKFETEIAPQLMKELNLSNVMEVPRLEKIAINMGVSDKDNPKVLEGAVKNLAKITGQKPIVTKAKKSISGIR
jgi:large subunit ribosomal protein L5